MKIFSIGDSHSSFNFNDIAEVVPIGLGPVTMFRVGRDRMDFREHLPSGCAAIFCFGEIDVRNHIAKHSHALNENEIIESLVKEYIDIILEQDRNGVVPIVMSVTPACRATSLTVYVGTDEQRARYCKKMMTFLRYYCLKNNIDMLDVYDYYADSDGHLIFDLSDKANHILDNRFVKQELDKLIKNKFKDINV